jgi:hypothetical protein
LSYKWVRGRRGEGEKGRWGEGEMGRMGEGEMTRPKKSLQVNN